MKADFILAVVVFGSSLFAQQQAQTPQPATDPKELAGITGKTVAPSGQPLKKTKLTLRPASGMGQISVGPDGPHVYTSTSDAEGKFVFEAIPAGKYTLWAERQGYLNQSYGAKHNFAQGTILTLDKGQQITDLVFSLTPQAVNSGKVLDEDGDPMSGVMLRLQRQMYVDGRRKLQMMGGANSDENGDFKLTRIGPGKYYLAAVPQQRNGFMEPAVPGQKSNKPEEDYVLTYYPGVLEETSATAIDITAGRDLPGMDIRLKKAQVFKVKGKLTGEIPASSAQRVRVMVQPQGDMFFGYIGGVQIGKDGSFELTHVQPGTYSLVAMSMQGQVQVIAREPIVVGDQNVDGVALEVQSSVTISGSIKVEGTPKTDPTQSPSASAPQPASVRVGLTPLQGPSFGNSTGIVGNDNTFTIKDLVPGKYRVNSYSNPAGTYLKSVQYGNQEVLGADIDIASGGGAALVLTFSASGGEVSGSVQGDDSNPVQGGAVTLVPDPPDPQLRTHYLQAGIDQTGHFTMKNVPPGKYRVYAWEEIESGAYIDPDFTKPFESSASAITVNESGRETVTLKRISVARIEEAKQKGGR